MCMHIYMCNYVVRICVQVYNIHYKVLIGFVPATVCVVCVCVCVGCSPVIRQSCYMYM